MKAALSLVLVLVVQFVTWVPLTQAQPSCRFVLGFEALRNETSSQLRGSYSLSILLANSPSRPI